MVGGDRSGISVLRQMGRMLACAGMLMALAPAHAGAEGGLIQFDIPAQPLDGALLAYTRATGLSVLVSSRLSQGQYGSAVRGRYTARQALDRLLASTPLQARYVSDSAFTLVAPGPQGQAALKNYAGVIQRTLTRALCHSQAEAFGRYRAGLRLWFTPAGAIERAELVSSSGLGDTALPDRLRGLLMDRPPPPGLEQPVGILLTQHADPAAVCRAAAH
ncbi:STN domain-containing protein [Bordetella hinzii]|uniref:TonB-dependent outer membrane receptor n=2 Tax=Bordetella hinzii TaxID=103855 RepID=A0AAN1VI40_9BORD|nr:STN domain-containing protein [Bordetella hinzii]AKQ55030.1 hypothetical protein ACR54_01708 [Bordetella hinzii]AKQ59540.1 hypothetical protein ACR55_01667 [Bordetella hinzii]AZW19318.1 TonB-dependent outer membrane receptor [Bordetella hinzii]KCB24780.1 secretin and TonB N-terminal short domain protein [Bordetella hinzii OH87 BAL007II]KCB33871.1 secretin and TonB N-terminal short domain protein [Bordetella hinzii L60]